MPTLVLVACIIPYLPTQDNESIRLTAKNRRSLFSEEITGVLYKSCPINSQFMSTRHLPVSPSVRFLMTVWPRTRVGYSYKGAHRCVFHPVSPVGVVLTISPRIDRGCIAQWERISVSFAIFVDPWWDVGEMRWFRDKSAMRRYGPRMEVLR